MTRIVQKAVPTEDRGNEECSLSSLFSRLSFKHQTPNTRNYLPSFARFRYFLSSVWITMSSPWVMKEGT